MFQLCNLDGVSPRTAEVLVVININETTKNASFLVQDLYNVTILENALVGSTVLKLNLRDSRKVSFIMVLKHSYSNGDFLLFIILSPNCEISLTQFIPHRYNFTTLYYFNKRR